VPDVELELTAGRGEVSIRPGAPTRVWSYSGRVLHGPQDVLQPVPDSYLGPTIRLRTGQKVRVHFVNELPEPTIIHWHGMDVPAEMDGHPRFAVEQGQRYVYEFEVLNRAGTYWYHPHHHNRTGPQVYNGLAGLLLVSDAEESALNLPSGADEIACVLQDRTFDRDNQFVYVSGMPMDAMAGFLGDVVLVNGRSQPSLSLATRAYRLRLLNGSNSRVYKLAWSDDSPMVVVGTDGGLVERPLERPFVTLVPGQRLDVVLDLSGRPVGTRLELRSLAFPSAPFDMGMGMGMGRGMMMGRGRGGPGGMAGGLPNGSPFSLFTIRIDRASDAAFRLPQTLSAFDSAWQPPSANVAPRVLPVEGGMMQWLLNGRTFEMEQVAPNEIVTAGSKEIWEFTNTSAAMMGMRLAHPLHLHGRQFRVLKREIDPTSVDEWASLRDGLTDEGWKDTFLLMPGERVQILVQFSRHPGLYLYHCHNLEHEDMGMMRNYKVVAGEQ
jgi:FtsP/CotA-like multicopper oxidase with cupredoxin domain